MIELLFLALALGGIAWWQLSARARETAARHVAAACQESGVQWLDGTVILRRVELARDAHGERCLRRTYVFEYCDDGVSRRQGFLALRGTECEGVGFGPTLVRSAP